MSATQTPQPAGPQPAPTPERHCQRCGSALGPDQEWCLACGAATTTYVAGPRGWRLPLVVAAALVVLAVAAAVLAIVELSRGPERVAQAPAASPTPSPAATPTPVPTATSSPLEGEGTPGATTATPSPSASPSESATPSPTPGTTPSATPSSSASLSSGSFADWPTGRSAWTIVLESARTRAGAERVARSLSSKGDTVGILHSDDFPTLNKGYWVVFSGQYDTRKAAEDAMSSLPAKRSGAYVRHVSAK